VSEVGFEDGARKLPKIVISCQVAEDKLAGYAEIGRAAKIRGLRASTDDPMRTHSFRSTACPHTFAFLLIESI